ncbi:MAG: rod shape-determining protein MreC [Puniceicoccales bacterium]|nr:rod shape-determining protein MreC [Puniceicoccales bacterium]
MGLFFLCLLGLWLLPAALRIGARNALQELQAPIWSGSDALHRVLAHGSLRAQSKEWLEQQLVELSHSLAWERLLERISVGTAALKGGDIPAKEEFLGNFRPLYARVLRRDSKAWWREVLLSVGIKDSVQEGTALVCGDHLAGKVLATFPSHSVGLLVTDPRFRAIVHAFGDGRPLVYEGVAQSGFGPPIGRVSCVPGELRASPQRPLQIVTSSLSGSYPDGLAVGTVFELRPSSDGIFQEGQVRLYAPLAGVRELVLLSRAEHSVSKNCASYQRATGSRSRMKELSDYE